MEYRQLGRTGLFVSELGLGTNQIGRVVDAAGTTTLIDRAQDLGVNFLDTADIYADGASEELLGKALVGRRDAFVIASKTGAQGDPGRLSRKRITDRLEASLRRLATSYIDVYYLHMPEATTPLEESLRVLEDAVRDGKVRYAALSNHAAWQVAEAIGLAERHGWSPIAASQVQYNLIDRGPEAEMIGACGHLGVSLIPWSPLAGGFLTGKYERRQVPPPDTRFGRSEQPSRYLAESNFDRLDAWRAVAKTHGRDVQQFAIAWLLAHRSVASVIAGATNSEQFEANAGAIGWSLSAEEIQGL